MEFNGNFRKEDLLGWSVFENFPEPLDRGRFGTVYRSVANPSIVVKVLNGCYSDCEHEFLMQKEAHEVGISSPRPYCTGKFLDFDGEHLAFAMDYVPGVTFAVVKQNYDSDFYDRLLDIWGNELSFAWKAGFSTRGGHDRNVLYDKETDKVTLIDFGKWGWKK